jgi:hypothetical protein
MTKEEAFLFFPHEEDDDIGNLYEQRVFEYKQFFLSSTPFRIVFLAKEKKMKQMHTAYLFFSGQSETQETKAINAVYNFSDSILETFNNYQQNLNLLKNKISQSTTVPELSALINELLQLRSSYYQNWTIEEDFIEKEIAITKEIDPMELLLAIQEFNKIGGFTFDDLNSKRNISPILLINEAKRLSLCRKLEKNG